MLAKANVVRSSATHLREVRLATEGDELRSRLLLESKQRVSENLLRERAQVAAEDMALSLTKAEYAAREATATAEELHFLLEEAQREVMALREALAASERAHQQTQSLLAAERSAHDETRKSISNHREETDEEIQNLNLAHEKALSGAQEQREYWEAEVEERRIEHQHLLKAHAFGAKSQLRALRHVVADVWAHKGMQYYASQYVSRQHKLLAWQRGWVALSAPVAKDNLSDKFCKWK